MIRQYLQKHPDVSVASAFNMLLSRSNMCSVHGLLLHDRALVGRLAEWVTSWLRRTMGGMPASAVGLRRGVHTQGGWFNNM